MATNDRAFIPTTIAVLTVSNSRTEDDDKSGKLLVNRVTESGHQLHEKGSFEMISSKFGLLCHPGLRNLTFKLW